MNLIELNHALRQLRLGGMATDESLKWPIRMRQMLLGGAECHWDRRFDPHEIGYVQHERLPRILVDEPSCGIAPVQATAIAAAPSTALAA